MPRAAKMMAETKLAMERYFFIGSYSFLIHVTEEG